jgi:hypothetical protein
LIAWVFESDPPDGDDDVDDADPVPVEPVPVDALSGPNSGLCSTMAVPSSESCR